MDSAVIILAMICIAGLIFGILSFAAVGYLVFLATKDEDDKGIFPFPVMGMPHQHDHQHGTNGKKPKEEGGNYI